MAKTQLQAGIPNPNIQGEYEYAHEYVRRRAFDAGSPNEHLHHEDGNLPSDKDFVSIEPFAKALSLLDCEVKSGRIGLNSAGARLSKESCDAGDLVAHLLQGNNDPLVCLLPQESEPCSLDRKSHRFLYDFLSRSLKRVIQIGVKEQGQGAGAIYLHNWQHDELVMAASSGFPLHEPAWHTDLITDLKHDAVLPDALRKEKPSIRRDLPLNLGRLHHIAEEFGPLVRSTTIARHPWVQEELRGRYDTPGDVSHLDCNTALIGVAYYRPGRGITGQLFHPEEGPKLERPAFAEIPDFGSQFDAAATADSLGESLKGHLQSKLLRKYTVVYSQRDAMASGRQVKAGLYEGLQFPGSPFIGPFMGTVLRFNGERLGILKIEKHRLEPSRKKPWLREVNPFNGTDTARFLVFAYALAGTLYALKHHAGFDLTTAWTGMDATT